MNYRFFAIPALAPDEAEAALNRFCAAHRVASLEKQFVSDGECLRGGAGDYPRCRRARLAAKKSGAAPAA